MTTQSPKEIWNLPAAGTPYIIRHQEQHATITMGQAIRILAGEEQTGGRFTICAAVGPQGAPVPQHWHESEHDTFVCVRGALQMWADDQSRVLSPGGFANVPPGVRHSYRFAAPHTEMVGLISTGGFEAFFAQTGWVFDGGGYPVEDDHPTDKKTFAEAGAKHDVHFVTDPVYVEPTSTDADTALPGNSTAYFLRPGQGPRFAWRGATLTALCTGCETEGRFGMAMIEGARGAALPRLSHADDDLLLYVVDGQVTVDFGGGDQHLHAGDSVCLPAGSRYTLSFTGGDDRILAFATGDVLHRLFAGAGKPWAAEIYPEAPLASDDARERAAVADLATTLG